MKNTADNIIDLINLMRYNINNKSKDINKKDIFLFGDYVEDIDF